MKYQTKVKVLLGASVIALLFLYACSHNQSEKRPDNINEKSKEIERNDSIDPLSKLTNNQTHSLKFELTNGKIDGYWVRLPYNYNKRKLWPVIVYFHGSGYLETEFDSISCIGPAFYAFQDTSQSGELRNQLFSNFIIITPHLKGTGEENPALLPSWTKEFKTIDAIIDTVLVKYSGNKEKVYLTGVSLGGAACWLMPNYLKSPIAAVVPVCGTPQGHYGSSDPRKVERTSTEVFEMFHDDPFKTVPVWNTCNARDGYPQRIFQETAVRSIEKKGGDKFLRLTTVMPSDSTYLKNIRIFTSFDKSGHNAWRETYSSIHIYKWMLSFNTRITSE